MIVGGWQMTRCSGFSGAVAGQERGAQASLRSRWRKWVGRSFCTSRRGLLRCVREYCGDVAPAALAVIERLPEFHHEQTKPAGAMTPAGSIRVSFSPTTAKGETVRNLATVKLFIKDKRNLHFGKHHRVTAWEVRA